MAVSSFSLFFQLDVHSSKQKKLKPAAVSAGASFVPSAAGAYDATEFYGTQDDTDPSDGSFLFFQTRLSLSLIHI